MVKLTKQQLIIIIEREGEKNVLALLDSVVTVQFSRIINHILKWLKKTNKNRSESSCFGEKQQAIGMILQQQLQRQRRRQCQEIKYKFVSISNGTSCVRINLTSLDFSRHRRNNGKKMRRIYFVQICMWEHEPGCNKPNSFISFNLISHCPSSRQRVASPDLRIRHFGNRICFVSENRTFFWKFIIFFLFLSTRVNWTTDGLH